jgi:hypothetical protein
VAAGPPCIRQLPSDPKELCALVGVAENLAIVVAGTFTIARAVGQDYATEYVFDGAGDLISVRQSGFPKYELTCVAGPAMPPDLPPFSTSRRDISCHVTGPTQFESLCAALPPPEDATPGCEVRGCRRIATDVCKTAFSCPEPLSGGLPFDCHDVDASAGTSGGPLTCCAGVPLLLDAGLPNAGDAGAIHEAGARADSGHD